MLTRSGVYFDFADPKPEMVTVLDIAFGLANQARFNGQTSFYSIAQHSVHVSQMVEPKQAFAALLHDAAEAYVGDLVSPLKALCPDFKAVEKRVHAAIAAKFGIPVEQAPMIKHADLRALNTERRDLGHGWHDDWGLDRYPADPMRIQPLGPEEARHLFLARFDQLRMLR